jgi:hypothetical protein
MKNKAKKQKIFCRENSRNPVSKRQEYYHGAQKRLSGGPRDPDYHGIMT